MCSLTGVKLQLGRCSTPELHPNVPHCTELFTLKFRDYLRLFYRCMLILIKCMTFVCRNIARISTWCFSCTHVCSPSTRSVPFGTRRCHRSSETELTYGCHPSLGSVETVPWPSVVGTNARNNYTISSAPYNFLQKKKKLGILESGRWIPVS